MKNSFYCATLGAAVSISMLGLVLGSSIAFAQAPTLIFNAPSSAASVAQVKQSLRLRRLFIDYYQANARFDPIGATYSGDNRFDDQLGMSIAPRQRAQQLARYRSFAKRLQASTTPSFRRRTAPATKF